MADLVDLVDGEVAGPLAGIRVVDLATSRAELAGRTLADLGAEVIKVEPPEGCDARRIPPFDRTAGDGNDGQSLYWAAVGLGKRSVVLDLLTPKAKASFLRLVESADVLIESFEPGFMDGLGLGHAHLCELNPRLIYLSVAPYGQEGPKAHWPATDLTIEAASSRISLQGDRDRPPLPVGYPQASFHSGSQAACDVIIALNERAISGLGQRLDLSMQEAMIWSLMDAPGYPPNTGDDPPGAGDDRAMWDMGSRAFECGDGYVTGQAGGADLSPYSKRELMQLAVTHDVRIAPINTTNDLFEDPQLAGRGYWRTVGDYVHPGPAARLSRTPMELRRPAPALGQDQPLLDPLESKPDRPPTARPPLAERAGLAFDGVRIADFSWVGVGPITAKAFADHGATVVRVESETRLDVLRRLPPFKDNYPGLNRSQWFANCNSSKLGVALNLATPQAKRIARQLVDWADVVVESFTPGTMAKLGLDYATVSAGRPELIMLSTCLLGQSGPYASYGGFGGHGAAIAGLHAITGWPDRIPCGPSGPYSDVIAPRYTVAALAAAIFERRRSGLGQHIDVSQVEAAIHFLEPLVLDRSVNGVVAGPAGMESATACPHGVYRAAGRERYIALAVETEAEWRALCSVAPLAEFAGDQFVSLDGRRAAALQIDGALRRWTSAHDVWALEAMLVAAGVPAAAVQRPSDLYRDRQLYERGFFVALNHAEMGPTPYDGLATRFSAKPSMLRGPAPLLGQHTEFVLSEFLGISADDMADCVAAGALH